MKLRRVLQCGDDYRRWANGPPYDTLVNIGITINLSWPHLMKERKQALQSGVLSSIFAVVSSGAKELHTPYCLSMKGFDQSVYSHQSQTMCTYYLAISL